MSKRDGNRPAQLVCKLCGKSIKEEPGYYEMDGEFYHSQCFEEGAVQILIDDCGAIRYSPIAPEDNDKA